jgi:hypothetical protein
MTATVHMASEILKLKTGRVTLSHKAIVYILPYSHCRIHVSTPTIATAILADDHAHTSRIMP